MIIGPGCHVTDSNRIKCVDSTADTSRDVLLKLSAHYLQNFQVGSGAQPTCSLVFCRRLLPKSTAVGA